MKHTSMIMFSPCFECPKQLPLLCCFDFSNPPTVEVETRQDVKKDVCHSIVACTKKPANQYITLNSQKSIEGHQRGWPSHFEQETNLSSLSCICLINWEEVMDWEVKGLKNKDEVSTGYCRVHIRQLLRDWRSSLDIWLWLLRNFL